MASISMASFNCESVKRATQHVRQLCRTNDFIALQEHWLIPEELDYMNTIDPDFSYCGCSAMDTSAGPVKGRPYGGVAVMWRKTRFQQVAPLDTGSTRVAGIRVTVADRSFIVLSVYMPCDSEVNLPLFTETLGVISAVIEGNDCECVIALGDYNANFSRDSLFGAELLEYCREQDWMCADRAVLGANSGTFTYRSGAHGTTSWLDHCIVTSAAMDLVTNVSVINEVNWSDHYPLIAHFNIDVIIPKCNFEPNKVNKIIWGNRDPLQISKYTELCDTYLQCIVRPNLSCSGDSCDNLTHCSLIDTYYNSLVKCMCEAAIYSYKEKSCRRKLKVTGWNFHVRDSHEQAKIAHQTWLFHGSPKEGPIYNNMHKSRKAFKNKLKWCQKHEDKIKMDIIASLRREKDFGNFWKKTNQLNYKTSLPVSVNGSQAHSEIANMFIKQFKVEQSAQDCTRGGPGIEPAHVGIEPAAARAPLAGSRPAPPPPPPPAPPACLNQLITFECYIITTRGGGRGTRGGRIANERKL